MNNIKIKKKYICEGITEITLYFEGEREDDMYKKYCSINNACT